MYSQRYGTPVVARATGGLADSVTDCTPETLEAGTASGFLFTEPTPEALLAAVGRAVDAFRTPGVWARLQRRGMAMDFSWDASARRYLDLYRALASADQ
jgi:starch synthase